MLRNRLEQMRTKRGCTRVQLAAIADVSEGSVLRHERYGVEPSTRVSLRYARYFGVAVEDIFWLEGDNDE